MLLQEKNSKVVAVFLDLTTRRHILSHDGLPPGMETCAQWEIMTFKKLFHNINGGANAKLIKKELTVSSHLWIKTL